MFDTTRNHIHLVNFDPPRGDNHPNADTLRQHCLDSASLWVLKRRANLPHRPRSGLPAVVRGG